MSASARSKELGAKSLKDVTDQTGLSSERLNTLCNDYPVAFDAMVLGLNYRKRVGEILTELSTLGDK